MIDIDSIFNGFSENKNVLGQYHIEQAPPSNRLKYIVDVFTNKFDLKPEVQPFEITYKNNSSIYNFFNVIVPLYERDDLQKTIFINAHHDVANLKSENVNDNTASIVNLMLLAQRIINDTIGFNYNIFLSFTDCEEYGGRGADYLSEIINMGAYKDVEFVLNLELTSHGEQVWVERQHNNINNKLQLLLQEHFSAGVLFIPFADSFIFKKNLINSLTIGTLPLTENGQYDVSHWNICHSHTDNYYNKEDMLSFVDRLFQFICSLT